MDTTIKATITVIQQPEQVNTS